jgi:hypothetical protein
MMISEKGLKWLIRFYPPLFFQRIWVVAFKKDFTGVSVKISKSLFNKNYNLSIFGGTLFAAADPFYPILFQQILTRRGYKIVVWLKSAQINYLKPGHTDLHFNIDIDELTITEAGALLNKEGKYIKTFVIEMFNTRGELCVSVQTELYVRNLSFDNRENG